ncbi:Uncharacterized protein SCF082_LOCUS6940 [Durusdinium trenchii]|uniref:Uncharacterized protein n=1 Tax=Durusdinium trenchii TaxID=1381693 RepID=A0ABP0IJF3_9DINO
MFQVTSRSAGKAQVLRVGLDRWNQECDLSCLAGYILDEMYRFKDPENLLVFPNETIALLLNRYIEGDFHEELKNMLDSMDPAFKPEQCSMWVENLPASTTNMLVTTEAADEKITALNDTHTKFQFQADALSLARDAAQLARLFGEESKTERACRMETAQLLSGEELPEVVISSLLNNSKTGSLVGIVNLTPYDAHLEMSLLKRKSNNPEHQFRSLSLSTDHVDWKHGGSLMGNVRKYDPVPPPSESLNTSEFPLKLAKLTVNPALKGVKKYRIELANEVRARYLDHPVYGGDWRSLILDFDRKFCSEGERPTDKAIVPAEVEEDPVPPAFTSEPSTLDQLQEAYLVAHQDVDISHEEFQLAHGKSTWLKAERVQKMIRENSGGGCRSRDNVLDSEEEFSEDSPADSDRTRRLGDWDEEEPKKKKVKVEDTKTVKPKEEEKPEQNLKQMTRFLLHQAFFHHQRWDVRLYPWDGQPEVHFTGKFLPEGGAQAERLDRMWQRLVSVTDFDGL